MAVETLTPEIARLLNDTLSPDKNAVSAATEGLDRLSCLPVFPLSILAVVTGGYDRGQMMAAATYLKNFTKHWVEGDTYREFRFEFRNRLVQALLRVESLVLKVLVEAFRFIVIKDFVKGNSWPELVLELKSVIQNSNLISESESQWKTVNALTLLQTIIKPFQYFLNPKVSNELVPHQLELIAKEILVPLQAVFHHFLDKVLFQGKIEMEIDQSLLIICKCMYFAVRSYMPSALNPLLPSFCGDLFGILDSMNLDAMILEDRYLLRLKTGKRSLIICRALVTRHRKHADKLMPNFIDCAFRIAKQSANIDKMNFLSERIVSLALDVISNVLETGPGWRIVSPHFSSLLESAIFPAIVLNQKDISEWEEDQEEYIRKNLPSDLEEILGWTEDLFTARKSAINLLGIIAMSKGPPMVSASKTSASVKRKKGDKNKGKDRRSSVGELLVIPYLSKFPMPSDARGTPIKLSYDYYGVLMAYGGLQDFLKERNSGYTITLVRTRVLPLYSLHRCLPHLIAAANWVIGELASCFPQEISADIYRSLMKALTMSDEGACSYYPVRASAAGAIAKLLENDYVPPDWLSLLDVLINRMSSGDENESSLLFQLLKTVLEVGEQNVAVHIPLIVSNVTSIILKHLPPIPEPWPQVVECGFTALAVIAQTWEDSMPDEIKQSESNREGRSVWAAIARSFSSVLQQAWLTSIQQMGEEFSGALPPPSCIEDASALLGFIMRFIKEKDEATELKITELLLVWADLIADWHSWEEMEDVKIFSSIEEAVHLHKKFDSENLSMRRIPSKYFPTSTQHSIIEGIGAFVTEAISAYPSATWRACSSTHLLLHVPRFSFESENIKQSLAIAFTQAAFSRFRDIQNNPIALWKPLLLVISSCYLCYPEDTERVLQNDEEGGFTVWACGLACISGSSFEPALSSESEIKLAVMTLAKLVERLLQSPSDIGTGVLRDCFVSLMEASIHLKEVQVEEEDGEDDDDDDEEEEEDEEEETTDEESEYDEHEETEEDFLDRYAKAANALESELVVEGDVEDEVEELDLGEMDRIDAQRVVFSLIGRHEQVLVQGQLLPSQLVEGILGAFPEYGLYFQASY